MTEGGIPSCMATQGNVNDSDTAQASKDGDSAIEGETAISERTQDDITDSAAASEGSAAALMSDKTYDTTKGDTTYSEAIVKDLSGNAPSERDITESISTSLEINDSAATQGDVIHRLTAVETKDEATVGDTTDSITVPESKDLTTTEENITDVTARETMGSMMIHGGGIPSRMATQGNVNDSDTAQASKDGDSAIEGETAISERTQDDITDSAAASEGSAAALMSDKTYDTTKGDTTYSEAIVKDLSGNAPSERDITESISTSLEINDSAATQGDVIHRLTAVETKDEATVGDTTDSITVPESKDLTTTEENITDVTARETMGSMMIHGGGIPSRMATQGNVNDSDTAQASKDGDSAIEGETAISERTQDDITDSAAASEGSAAALMSDKTYDTTKGDTTYSEAIVKDLSGNAPSERDITESISTSLEINDSAATQGDVIHRLTAVETKDEATVGDTTDSITVPESKDVTTTEENTTDVTARKTIRMMIQKLYPTEYHSDCDEKISQDDGFVSESEEVTEFSEEDYDDSVKDADYIQESDHGDSEGTDVNSDDGTDGETESEIYEWTPQNVSRVLEETKEKCMEVETTRPENSEESLDDSEEMEDDSDYELPCRRQGLHDKDCIFDENNPKVFIKGFHRGNAKSKHDRVYDCIHACLFCHELFTNIQSHYDRKHLNQAQVKSIKELKDLKAKEADKGETEKLNKKLKLEMKMLRNQGNHLHNMKVLKHREGELLLPRRRIGKFNLNEYGPCPSCKEWMVLNTSITNHQKTCPAKLETEYHKGSTIIQVGIITGKVQHTGSKRLLKEVIPSMKKDEITEIAVADPLIMSLGDIWFMKNIDNKRRRKYYASFHMRLAARLLSAFRRRGSKDSTISDMLTPGNFDKVAEVALEICSNDMGQSGELQHPSTAVKTGFDVMRLASSKVGIAIRQGNKVMKTEAEEFMYLMNKEWSVKVNKLARSTLSERQFNRKKELPHPEDIVTFSSYLVKQLQSLDLDPTTADSVNFRQTAMLVEARLMLYNRRRPGELEALR